MMQTSSFDTVMRALADPTRRALFERVAVAGEITVAGLTEGSGVTQGAVSQHLKMLRQADLVAERPDGRRVWYRCHPEGLRPVAEWMNQYADFWQDRFANLRTLMKELDP